VKSSAIYTPNVQDSENGRVVTIVTEDKLSSYDCLCKRNNSNNKMLKVYNFRIKSGIGKWCYLKNTIPVIPLLPSFDKLIEVL
jgi:hypothetical protein